MAHAGDDEELVDVLAMWPVDTRPPASAAATTAASTMATRAPRSGVPYRVQDRDCAHSAARLLHVAERPQLLELFLGDFDRP